MLFVGKNENLNFLAPYPTLPTLAGSISYSEIKRTLLGLETPGVSWHPHTPYQVAESAFCGEKSPSLNLRRKCIRNVICGKNGKIQFFGAISNSANA